MTSKSTSQKRPARGAWLDSAVALTLHKGDITANRKWKRPSDLVPVVNNGFTLPEMQNNIVFNHREVGLRAAVAISSKEPGIIAELSRDASPIVRIALLDSNPKVTTGQIIEMGSVAIRRGEQDVFDAAKAAMLRRGTA